MTSDTTSKHVSVFKQFGTDRNAEENGKWFKFGTEIEVKIRRYKSKHTIAAQKEMERPYESMRSRGKLPDDVAEKVLMGMICTSIIADWRGIYGDDDQEIPYSPEMAYQLMEALPELRDQIVAVSMEMDGFRAKNDEAVTKN